MKRENKNFRYSVVLFLIFFFLSIIQEQESVEEIGQKKYIYMSAFEHAYTRKSIKKNKRKKTWCGGNKITIQKNVAVIISLSHLFRKATIGFFLCFTRTHTHTHKERRKGRRPSLYVVYRLPNSS